MFFCLSENRLRGGKPLRVLDFGGGGGDYFYQFQKFVPYIAFDWTVVETPALAEAMQQKHGGESQKIRWVDSLEMTEDEYDFVLCSSVLQYLEQPFEVLEDLVKKSGFVIINRIPLIDSSDHFVALQRILTKKKRGSYPAHFFSEKRFLKTLSMYGSIPMRWVVAEDQPVVNWRAHANHGLLLLVNSPN
jgi:putative methyltransferase (TIGR04325 family)